MADISITDRWAPLVRDRDAQNPPVILPKIVQRTLAAALCLAIVVLVLWMLA